MHLSPEQVQAMVDEEVETVTRELAGDPSSALLVLTDTRRDMDEMAMKAQVRVGWLLLKSPCVARRFNRMCPLPPSPKREKEILRRYLFL